MHTVPDPAAAAERRFFAGLAFAALVVVLAGFAGSYYLRPFVHGPRPRMAATLPAVVHVHDALFTTWIALFVVQSSLIAVDQVARHRRLGLLAAGLVPAMLVVGLMAAVRGARDGWNPGGPYADAISFMFVGVADLVVFGTLTTAGLAWRRRPGVHKRLMLLGTLGGLLWPAITRLPVIRGRLPVMLGLIGLLVLAPAARDLTTRARERWWTLGIGLAVLATFPLGVAVANSSAWRAIATWMLG